MILAQEEEEEEEEWRMKKTKNKREKLEEEKKNKKGLWRNLASTEIFVRFSHRMKSVFFPVFSFSGY